MGRLLQRHEIIGCRLQSIFQTYQLVDDYLDSVWNTLVMDSGLAFNLPGFSDEPLVAVEIPQLAVPTSHPMMKQATLSPIARLLRPRDEEEWYPDSVWLQTESGIWIGQTTTAPHGTGAARIRIFQDSKFDCSEFVTYWNDEA